MPVNVEVRNALQSNGTMLKNGHQSSDTTNGTSGLSYAHKASSVEFIYTTVGELLEQVVSERPNHTAVVSVHQGIKKSYAELNEEVNTLAVNLLNLGLKKGDRVAVWGRNSYEWMLVEFALAKTGMILVTVCPAYQSEELEYALNHVKCSALVAQDNMENIDYYGILCGVEPAIATNTSKALSSSKMPHLKHVIFVTDKPQTGTLNFKDLLVKQPQRLYDQLAAINIEPDDPFCIQYTSGTTGRSKAAIVSHFQCINLGASIKRRFHYDESVVLLLQVPMYHAMGCVIGVFATLNSRGTVVMPSARYNSVDSLNAIASEGCTSMLAAPTMAIDMMSKPELNSIDLSSLKTVGMGGSNCLQDIIEKTNEMLKVQVLVGYGCTETSGVISAFDPTNVVPQLYETVGRPLDLLEVKIVDQNKNTVPVGQEGQIVVRGFNVFLGYWGDEQKTKESMGSDRWYHTGDLGKLDIDGFLYVVGRQKDMIIRGGENIYPAEIEQFLIKHAAIRDAQVIGVPDHKMGEEACAFILLKPGMTLSQDDVKNYCKGKASPPFVSLLARKV